MASQGPNGPATVTTQALGGVDWANPTNATASDDSRAVATLAAGESTYYLKATNFGFSIPAGSTINGVVVQVEFSTDVDGNTFSAKVRLVKDGTIQGDTTLFFLSWGTTDSYVTYGSSSSMWGLTLDVDDINDSTFGASFFVSDIFDNVQVRVDHIRITVHYTEAGHPAVKRMGGVQHAHGGYRAGSGVKMWRERALGLLTACTKRKLMFA